MADDEEEGEEALNQISSKTRSLQQSITSKNERTPEPSMSRALNKSVLEQQSMDPKSELSISRSINQSLSKTEQRSLAPSVSRSINKSALDQSLAPKSEQGLKSTVSILENQSMKSEQKSLAPSSRSINKSEQISGSASNIEINQSKEDDQLSRKTQRSKVQYSQLGSNASSNTKLLPKSKTTSNMSTKPPPNQRRFREMIGKHETRNEELGKQKGDLIQRLDVLENSVPAVMLWNIWRMSQGTPVSSLHRAMKKQFRASGELYCPRTPSRHYDCRVREAEANRKLAEKRAFEAKSILLEKQTLLDSKRQKLEEARKIQQDRKEKIDQLTKEAKELKETTKNLELEDGACIAGECGDIECRRLLSKLSGSSIKSTDVECLDKLQHLAETELMMKKQIEDLERREETYMKTLQQADDLWSKVEGDASTLSLQAQLDSKTDRIALLEQALEEQKIKTSKYRAELEKYTSIEKIDAAIGRETDLAQSQDKAIAAKVKLKHRSTSSEIIELEEKETLARFSGKDQGISAIAESGDFGVSVGPEVSDLGVDSPDDLISKGDKSTDDFVSKEDRGTDGISEDLISKDAKSYDLISKSKSGDLKTPEDLAQAEKYKDAIVYLDQLGSRLYDDDYSVCDPEYECQQDYPETEDEQLISVTTLVSTTAESFHGKTSKDVASTPRPEILEPKESKLKDQESKESKVPPKSDMNLVQFDSEDESKVATKSEIGDEKSVQKTPESPTTIQEAMGSKSEGFVPDKSTETSKMSAKGVEGEQRGPDEKQLKSWLGTSNVIRATIADCLDCQEVMGDADKLANEIAAYTGDEVKSYKLAERKAEVSTKDLKSTKSEVSEGLKEAKSIKSEVSERSEKVVPSEVKLDKSEKSIPEEALEELSVKTTKSKIEPEDVASKTVSIKSVPSTKEMEESVGDIEETGELSEKVSSKAEPVEPPSTPTDLSYTAISVTSEPSVIAARLEEELKEEPEEITETVAEVVSEIAQEVEEKEEEISEELTEAQMPVGIEEADETEEPEIGKVEGEIVESVIDVGEVEIEAEDVGKVEIIGEEAEIITIKGEGEEEEIIPVEGEGEITSVKPEESKITQPEQLSKESEEKLSEIPEEDECKPLIPDISIFTQPVKEPMPTILPGVQVADRPYLTIADIEGVPREPVQGSTREEIVDPTCTCNTLELSPPSRLDDTPKTPGMTAPASTVPSETLTRIALTRTQIIEKETIEIVTQTTDNVGTQTIPVQKVISCLDGPEIITVSEGIVTQVSTIVPTPRVQDQSTITVSAAAIQTDPIRTQPESFKSSATSALKLESELTTAGKDKPDCVCCVCGTKATSRMVTPREAPLVTKMPIMLLSSPGTSPSPYRPEQSQPKVLCPECRIKRLERQRTQRIVKDPFVPNSCACNKFQAQQSCPVRGRGTKDQSSMAKISKCVGKDRTKKKEAWKETVVSRLTSKSDVDKATTSSSDGKASLDGCICYDPKGKKHACMCGDPFAYRGK